MHLLFLNTYRVNIQGLPSHFVFEAQWLLDPTFFELDKNV